MIWFFDFLPFHLPISFQRVIFRWLQFVSMCREQLRQPMHLRACVHWASSTPTDHSSHKTAFRRCRRSNKPPQDFMQDWCDFIYPCRNVPRVFSLSRNYESELWFVKKYSFLLLCLRVCLSFDFRRKRFFCVLRRWRRPNYKWQHDESALNFFFCFWLEIYQKIFHFYRWDLLIDDFFVFFFPFFGCLGSSNVNTITIIGQQWQLRWRKNDSNHCRWRSRWQR